jgi:protein-tyrosine kinase
MTSLQTLLKDGSQETAANRFRPWSVEEWLREGRRARTTETVPEQPQFQRPERTGDADTQNPQTWLFTACEPRIAELVLRTDARLGGRTPRLVQFIGVDRGVGGSTVAFAYASASATLRRRRVLFLSADEGESGLGVLECVAQGTPLDAAITTLNGTLFCGALTGANNSGVAARTLMADATLIQALRAAYDEVVVDCRCTDSSQGALTIAPNADGVILVIQAGRTRQTSVQMLLDALVAVKGEVLGAVLNRSAPFRRSASGSIDG